MDHLPTVVALNKIDLSPDGEEDKLGSKLAQPAIPISALTGRNIDTLLLAVEAVMERHLKKLNVFLPYDRGDLMSMFYERGQVVDESHEATGMRLSGQIPARLLPYFEPYVIEEEGFR